MKIDEARALVYDRSYGNDGPASLADLATALSITLWEANVRIAKLEDTIKRDWRDRDRLKGKPLPDPCIYPEYQDANIQTVQGTDQVPTKVYFQSEYETNVKKPPERKFDAIPKTNRQWQEYYEACFWMAQHSGTTYGSSGFVNVVKSAYAMGWTGVQSRVSR